MKQTSICLFFVKDSEFCLIAVKETSSHILALDHTGPPPHVDFQAENLSLEHMFLPEFSEYSPLHNKPEKRNVADVCC